MGLRADPFCGMMWVVIQLPTAQWAVIGALRKLDCGMYAALTTQSVCGLVLGRTCMSHEDAQEC